MGNFPFLLCLFFITHYEAHVIPDNFLRTSKCDRYDERLPDTDSEFGTNIADYDPDVEICGLDANGKSFCFTIWSNDSTGIEVRKKGCLPSEADCTGHTTCVSHRKTRNLFFCCCEGDFCNKDFFYEPILTYSDEDTQVYDLPTFPKVLVILAFIVSCVLTAAYAKKKRPYSCIGDKRQRIQAPGTSTSAEPEPLLPIELLEIKAQGRFGTVWKAKYKNDFVAVKTLPSEYYELWLTEKDVFKLPSLDHENIVHFIATEERSNDLQNEYWIITAYQELGSLHDYLESNSVTWEQLCVISFTMARGLAHLHEDIPCGKSNTFKPSIAHRDFKSANVLLKNDLSACIADFGFAFVFRSQICDSRHAKVGTKRYMAPEVLEGAVGFSNNSFLCMDMYACGLVLWEILSRCSAHEDAESKYKLPYEAELGENISLDDLQEFVVSQKKRPVLKESWRKNPLLFNVCDIIEECWDHDADARLSSACVTERFSWYLRTAMKSETKLLYNIV